MKLPCEMVQDLLPLYHDNVCSEVSRTLVGEHLKECEDCSRVLKSIEEEIEVPKLEADAAQPLLSIKISWDKQKRKNLLRCLGAGVLAFVLFVAGWWGLTQWSIVPLKGSDYEILNRYQLSDGTVYLQYTWKYGNCANNVLAHDEDDGKSYTYRLRPILGKTDEEVGNELQPKTGLYFLPEEYAKRTSSGELVPVQEMYLGTPDDCILLWERGMELPSATPEQEEAYRQLQDSFAAPNAPEKPDPLQVEYVHADDDQEPNDNVQETMVVGTEPTMAGE